jgi:hypothetical protein
MAEFSLNIPTDIVDTLADVETRRVEASLMAGERVAVALTEYTAWLKAFWPAAATGAGPLKGFWPEVASGAHGSTLDDRHGNAPYRRLIRAMREEVSNLPADTPRDI